MAASDTPGLQIARDVDQVSLDCSGTFGGSIRLAQAATPPTGSVVAGTGIIWVENTATTRLAFTNSAGVASTIALAPTTATTDNALARFDGTAGLLQNSTAILADAGELVLTSTGTTTSGLSVTANSLTTGAGLSLSSSSADVSTRSLATFTSSAGAATGTTILTLNQAANQVALHLDGVGGGAIQFQEIGAVPGGAPAAGKGKLWVENTAPNRIVFTDDTGVSTVLSAGTGDVVGPGIATDNALTRFDGTTGKLIQNSTAILQDTGELALTSTGTTTNALAITASSLTTGRGLFVTSNSADATSRDLLRVENNNAGATGTNAAHIFQGANQRGLIITTSATSAEGLRVVASSMTTGLVASIVASALTSGSALDVQSSSADVSARNIVTFANTNAAATGATTLNVANASTGQVVNITGSATTSSVVNITGSALTTGSAINVTSGSASASTRSLITVANTNASATAATVISLSQAANAPSMASTSSATTANINTVTANSLTTGTAQTITGNALTTGSLIALSSSSTSTSTRSLQSITSSSTLATGTTILALSQAANQVTLDLQGTGGGSVQFQEIAAVPGGAPAAAKGKLWVRDNTPNRLIFSDDAGNTHTITPLPNAILGFGNDSIATAADTRYLDPWYSDAVGGTTIVEMVATRNGTLRNLFVRHTNANGNGNSIAYTVLINGVATAITCTVATGAAGQASDTVNTATVVQGDRIGIQAVKALSIGTGGQDIYATVEFGN